MENRQNGWRDWDFSLLLLGLYFSVFVYWKFWPSRVGFAVAGLAVVAVLLVGMIRAVRRGYFANRVDAFVHGYVVADVFLESIAFEAVRLFVGPQALPYMPRFHDNGSYLFCTSTLAILVGGNRWLALRRRRSLAIGQDATSSADVVPGSSRSSAASPASELAGT